MVFFVFNFISEFVISCGIHSPHPPPPPLYSVVSKSMEDVEMNGLSSVSRLYRILAGGQEAVAKPQFLHLWTGREGNHILSVVRMQWRVCFRYWAQSLMELTFMTRDGGGVLFVTVAHVNVSLLWDLRFHCAFDLMNEWLAVYVCMLSFQTPFL